MKRLAGLMTGLFLALSAVDVSYGSLLVETDPAETDGLAGEPDLDEDGDAAATVAIEGPVATCSAGGQQRFDGETGSAEQGYASEIRFPPWG